MPKVAKELSAAEVKRITAPGLYAVGGVAGLALQVTVAGARSWILRAKIGAKRRDIGLGGFPSVSLADARERARQARASIWSGVDPVAQRRAARAALIEAQARAMTFAEAARLAHKARAAEFRNTKHRADWLSALERYANPVIGSMDVAAIGTNHVLQVLEPIWKSKTETATRVRQRIESVLSWATVSNKRSGDNPARWEDNLRELLPRPTKLKSKVPMPALPFDQVPSFMDDLRQRQGICERALEFGILTGARSGEIRGATWAEVDLDAKLWTIPASRMKAGRMHQVPLSDAALAVLAAVPKLSEYLFTAPRGGSLHENALSLVCKRMKVAAVPHGFRSSFKDWARATRPTVPDEVSELCLAHVDSDATRAAYARHGLLAQRAELLAGWADFIAPTAIADNVTDISARRADRKS